MTDLQEKFAEGLREILHRTASRHGVPVECLRPFVCAGDPLECKVLVCGINPATDDRAFARFWQPPRFDFDSWYTNYVERKASQGRSPKRGTRARIMKFSKALQIHELKVLESNFDPRPSKNPPSHLDGEAFRYLLDTIEPKVLLLHGQEVFDAAASIVPAHIRVVRAERHFSRISGEGLARAIAECVAAAS